MKGLLVRPPWIDLILDGAKTWEVRGTAVSARATIALVRSGSGQVVGTCRVDGCVGPLTPEAFAASRDKHRVPPGWRGRDLPYPRTFAWVLADVRPLARPVAYRHPSGAVIWVRLDPAVVRSIESQST